MGRFIAGMAAVIMGCLLPLMFRMAEVSDRLNVSADFETEAFIKKAETLGRFTEEDYLRLITVCRAAGKKSTEVCVERTAIVSSEGEDRELVRVRVDTNEEEILHALDLYGVYELQKGDRIVVRMR